MGKDEKAGAAETSTSKREIGLRDVKRTAKNIKYLIDGLNEQSGSSAAIKRAVTQSGIVPLLQEEVKKLRELAQKIALQDFDN